MAVLWNPNSDLPWIVLQTTAYELTATPYSQRIGITVRTREIVAITEISHICVYSAKREYTPKKIPKKKIPKSKTKTVTKYAYARADLS